MRTSTGACLRRWAARAGTVAAILVTAACGGGQTVKPAKLTDFQSSATANVAWRASVGGSKRYLLKPALAGGSVFAASSDGQVTALDDTNGRQRWRVDTRELLSGGVGAGDDIVLVGSRKGVVLAYGADGKPLWRAQVSSEVMGAPQVAQGVALVRTVDGHMFALDAATGERKWEHQVLLPPLLLRADATVEVVGSTVLAGLPGGRVLALDVATGEMVWEAAVSQPKGDNEIERIADIAAPPIVDGEQACAAGYQGRIACLDVHKGTLLWARDASSAGRLGIDSATLYMTAPDGVVSAYDRQTGASLWKQDKLLNRAVTGPTVIGEHVIVGDYDGYLHVLDAEDGSFAARIATDGSAIVAPPLRAGPGVVVQTSGGGLFAVSVR
ncbi:MAG: outer membrane protein assembly factor BamB [Burkholderiales bacterium]|nr:outer membrane protein assembly factor BamB [Burkholderiales bacterium]